MGKFEELYKELIGEKETPDNKSFKVRLKKAEKMCKEFNKKTETPTSVFACYLNILKDEDKVPSRGIRGGQSVYDIRLEDYEKKYFDVGRQSKFTIAYQQGIPYVIN